MDQQASTGAGANSSWVAPAATICRWCLSAIDKQIPVRTVSTQTRYECREFVSGCHLRLSCQLSLSYIYADDLQIVADSSRESSISLSMWIKYCMSVSLLMRLLSQVV